jgi:putative copper resistance protein D
VGLAIALTGSLAWSGHGAATPGHIGELHLAADIVHLIASGLWVAALLPFAMVLHFASRGGMSPHGASEITRRFSNLATFSVAAILLTGIVNSWVLVGNVSRLTADLYGRLLLAKVGLFAVMLAIAAFNRFGLTPRLTRDVSRTARRLAVNSFLELALGMAVLAIVAVLGTVQAASHHHATATAEIPDDAAFVHIHGVGAMADVLIAPGRVGRADVIIHVLRDDLSELPARSVSVALIPPSGATDPETREAVHQSDTSWRVNGVEISEAGNWTVKVLVSVDAARTPLVLDAPIVIESRH